MKSPAITELMEKKLLMKSENRVSNENKRHLPSWAIKSVENFERDRKYFVDYHLSIDESAPPKDKSTVQKLQSSDKAGKLLIEQFLCDELFSREKFDS